MIHYATIVKRYCAVCGYLIDETYGLCRYCFQHNPLRDDQFSEVARRARQEMLAEREAIKTPGREYENVAVNPLYL